ncbi:MAG: DUF4158 domain-containing protein [Rhodospirillales bacterium]|nr:DUF4158 domain-containing protein [Rhodospirillales bacterium]
MRVATLARRYGRFSGEPTPDQLARHFHLDDADRAFVAEHRGDHNRLGVAVQLGSVRLLCTFLDDPTEAPAAAVRYAADQLAIEGCAEAMAAYAASEGRWRHGPRIRERYGYRQFTDTGIAFRLNRFLYALCWTGADVARIFRVHRATISRIAAEARATLLAQSLSPTRWSDRTAVDPTCFTERHKPPLRTSIELKS